MRLLVHRNCRGNSLVELVLLVPIYVLIIAGALLLGEMGLVMIQSHEANEYAAFQPGDQSEAAGLADSGILKANFLTPYEGELDLREDAIGDVPGPSEVEDLFEEMMKEQYWTTAHGSYTFQGGRLVFKISTSTHRWRMQDAKYVERYDLLGDNIPELVTGTLEEYMDRDHVQTSYNFMPKYLTWSRFGLEGAKVRTEYQTARRLNLLREVQPPSTPVQRLAPILGAGGIPHFPDSDATQPFWEPK